MQADYKDTALHVVSYNIKGLPSFALGREYKNARYGLIGKLLAGSLEKNPAQIVLLQEAFDARTAELIQLAGFKFQSAGPGPSSLFGLSAGLFILSQYPILEANHEAFGHYMSLSWDRFANKGVQFARIAIPGLPAPLEIFNTHLQAGMEDTSVRQRQVQTLLAFYRKHHKEGSPVIFGGDFNFRPGLRHPSYFTFAEHSLLQNAGEFCVRKGYSKVCDESWVGSWSRTVDHQFFSNSGLVEIEPYSLERNFRDPVENIILSDHPTLEISYRLRWPTSSLPLG